MRIETAVRDRLTPLLLRLRFPVHSPDDLVRLGSAYGGWWVPRSRLRAGAIAYCAGVGEDITFDRALRDEYGLDVWAFDPTPRAIEHMHRYGDGIGFRPVGWWDAHDTLRFHGPADPAHVSHSVGNIYGGQEYFDAEVTTVRALADELGHDTVDLVKMDVEGAETRVIPHLLAHGPLPEVLGVEFAHPYSLGHLFGIVGSVLAAGYVLVKVEERNATFVRSPTSD